ncbi:hypothetical protein JK635_02005 [Neobacillus sp. YIM B02564]|uniref:Transposase n=1 Tax=Neobacillus paridis TaxID=2803862 RepID=A0ABS1TKH0_9BACI|nr:hypothetical protein [Neobacillus paridis]MBL4951013.1 hypothetical protein [Neobacillus paridis]
MINYKTLCQCLADSERCLRKGNYGSNNNLKNILKGRSEQLEYMKNNYPNKYDNYIKTLDERLSKPYDFKEIVKSIPAQ